MSAVRELTSWGFDPVTFTDFYVNTQKGTVVIHGYRHGFSGQGQFELKRFRYKGTKAGETISAESYNTWKVAHEKALAFAMELRRYVIPRRKLLGLPNDDHLKYPGVLDESP